MSSVAYAGRSLELSLGESVLDGLLRSGIPVAHACKAGSCGSCMLRAVGGCVPPRAQVGLKDSWKEQGYFLSCVCVPEADMEVSEAGAQTLGAVASTLAHGEGLQAHARAAEMRLKK